MGTEAPTDPVRRARVLLVCQAGAALGIGHLTRMLALAQALSATDRADVRLLVQGNPLSREDLALVEHALIPLDADLSGVVAGASRDFNAGVVVFDLHPDLIPDTFGTLASDLRASGVRIVGVDALVEHCDVLDLTWVPSVLVDERMIAHCGAPVHFGWDSFLIAHRTPVSEWVPGNRVLVLTGGSDVTSQGDTLPRLVDAALPDRAEIHWVRGPYASEPLVPATPRLRWEVHHSPDGLGRLMGEANYALTIFGVTVFELLHHGVPSVVFSPYADRTFPELDEVAAVGAALAADGAETAVAALARLMEDDDRARALSETGRERMAVDGAGRLAGLIHSLIE